MKSTREKKQGFNNKVILVPFYKPKYERGLTPVGKVSNIMKTEINTTAYMPTIQEMDDILEKARQDSPRRYMQLLILKETGMRIGELVLLKKENLDIANRVITTSDFGMSGRKVYAMSGKLQDELARYLETSNVEDEEKQFLFNGGNKDSLPSFIRDARGNDSFTSHAFRQAIDFYRKEMGCPLDARRHLLGLISKDDVKITTDNKDRVELYDRWYPY